MCKYEPAGFRSTVVDANGKIIEHINDDDNSVYQLVNDKKIKIGTEKHGVDYSKLVGQSLGPMLYDPNPIQLNEVQITEKKLKSAFAGIALG